MSLGKVTTNPLTDAHLHEQVARPCQPSSPDELCCRVATLAIKEPTTLPNLPTPLLSTIVSLLPTHERMPFMLRICKAITNHFPEMVRNLSDESLSALLLRLMQSRQTDVECFTGRLQGAQFPARVLRFNLQTRFNLQDTAAKLAILQGAFPNTKNLPARPTLSELEEFIAVHPHLKTVQIECLSGPQPLEEVARVFRMLPRTLELFVWKDYPSLTAFETALLEAKDRSIFVNNALLLTILGDAYRYPKWDMPEAQRLYRQALDLMPNLCNALKYTLEPDCITAYRCGDTQKGDELLLRYFECTHMTPEVLLAFVKEKSQQNPLEARRILELGIARCERPAAFYVSLGILLARGPERAKKEEARALLEKGLDLGHDYLPFKLNGQGKSALKSLPKKALLLIWPGKI